jgi:hypothetical protein
MKKTRQLAQVLAAPAPPEVKTKQWRLLEAFAFAVNEDRPVTGGEFQLDKAPNTSRTVPLNGGIEVEVCAGNPYIVC